MGGEGGEEKRKLSIHGIFQLMFHELLSAFDALTPVFDVLLQRLSKFALFLTCLSLL